MNMTIVFTEQTRYRAVEYYAEQELTLPALEAHALVDAGHAKFKQADKPAAKGA